MRVDHHAFQRATGVALFGFAVQLAIGLVLLLFSVWAGDTAILFGAGFVLLGVLPWVGLIVVFNQHKLERLEALEHDELLAGRGETADSVFATADDELRVAARRLTIMHKWMMPILSLVMAGGLVLLAWLQIRFLQAVDRIEAEFSRTEQIGWAVAICLAFSAGAFIVSRFVAGMAKQPVWQNLRGGAGYMVGIALVTLALAVGIGFRFFNNDDVNEAMAWAIPIFMCVLAAEIVLNFILNLYRPRIADETPRPAFDSKLLSLFSAPDNLVRSINEAVNYQFGFDVASSWGYQLLLRSFAWLIGLGVAVVLALSCIVIVEPQEQAVKLARGSIVGDVHSSGLMWKLPWPFETAEAVDVTRVRELHLTNKQVVEPEVQLWSRDLGELFDKQLDPFIVGRAAMRIDLPTDPDDEAVVPALLEGATPEASVRVAERYSLIDAEMILRYRIHQDGGLLDYLHFGSDELIRQERITVREQAIRAIARGEVGRTMSELSLDDVFGPARRDLAGLLAQRVQAALDRNETGIEVIAIDIPLLRPAGDASPKWEEVSIAREARRQTVEQERLKVVTSNTRMLGDARLVPEVFAAVKRLQELRETRGPEDPEIAEQQRLVERMLRDTRGLAVVQMVGAEAVAVQTVMGARSRALQVRGQLDAYRAAPRLYRQRAIMQVYSQFMPRLFKYVVGIDPSRVQFDVDLTELNPMFNIGDALPDTSQETGP